MDGGEQHTAEDSGVFSAASRINQHLRVTVVSEGAVQLEPFTNCFQATVTNILSCAVRPWTAVDRRFVSPVQLGKNHPQDSHLDLDYPPGCRLALISPVQQTQGQPARLRGSRPSSGVDLPLHQRDQTVDTGGGLFQADSRIATA